MAATAEATKKKTASKAKAQEPAAEETPEVKEAPAEKKSLLDKPLSKKGKAITAARVSLLEQARNTWLVNVDMETTAEQCLDGSYWEHIAKQLRPGDEIHVMPDDMSWELVLHVAGQEPLFAHVVKKAYYDLMPATAPVIVPSRYSVNFAGAHHKWRVLRDGKPLKDGFETADLARRYAANHQQAVER